MTANFRDFEADFHSHLDSIRKDIHTLHESFDANNPKRDPSVLINRSDIVKRMQDHHSHMKEAVALMELESNEGTAEQRAASKQRLPDMKREAFRLEKEINGLKQQSVAADHADLMKRVAASGANKPGAPGAAPGAPGAAGAPPNKLDSQLSQLAGNTATMNKGTTTLRHALQYVVRMNEHGEAIIVELKKQDETITRITGVTAATDSELTAAQRVIRDMRFAGMKNQIIMAGVVIVLVVMIIALVYYEYARPIAASFSGGSSGSGTTSSGGGALPPQVASPSTGKKAFAGALDGFAPAPTDGSVALQPMLPSN